MTLLIASACLFFVLYTHFGYIQVAYANSVIIKDQAHVLDTAQVSAEASHLSDAISIYTTNTFTGDQNNLDVDAQGYITSDDMIVIEIDTTQHHLSIQSGSTSKLNDDQADEAVGAFKDAFNNGSYTAATIAAINSLQNALTEKNNKGNATLIGFVTLIIGIVFLGVVIFVFIIMRRRRGGPPRGGRSWSNRVYSSYPSSMSSVDNGGGSGTSEGGGGGGGSF
jgi:hypothetical protein